MQQSLKGHKQKKESASRMVIKEVTSDNKGGEREKGRGDKTERSEK